MNFMITANVVLGMLGPWQVVLIIIVIVLLFGGRKIPELMKGIGKGMTEFKKATKDDDSDKTLEDKEDDDKDVDATVR